MVLQRGRLRLCPTAQSKGLREAVGGGGAPRGVRALGASPERGRQEHARGARGPGLPLTEPRRPPPCPASPVEGRQPLIPPPFLTSLPPVCG